ncbi:Hypothetical predicted protein, partial [Olea europaea subsp. europaea]
DGALCGVRAVRCTAAVQCTEQSTQPTRRPLTPPGPSRVRAGLDCLLGARLGKAQHSSSRSGQAAPEVTSQYRRPAKQPERSGFQSPPNHSGSSAENWTGN